MSKNYLLLLLILPAYSFGMLPFRLWKLAKPLGNNRAAISYWEKEHLKTRERQFKEMNDRANFLLEELEGSKKFGEENSYRNLVDGSSKIDHNHNYLLGPKRPENTTNRQIGEE